MSPVMLSSRPGYGARQLKQTEITKMFFRPPAMRSPQRGILLAQQYRHGQKRISNSPSLAQRNYDLDHSFFSGPVRAHPMLAGFLVTQAALQVGRSQGQKTVTWT